MAKNNDTLLAKIEQKNQSGKASSPAESIRQALERMKGELAAALPKHLTPERLARVALTTIRTNPKLLECEVTSLIAAVMQSAQLGLEPGILGHAYFVPFNRKIKEPGKPDRWVKDVQFLIGYKGLVELARRSGQIQSIAAGTICKGDKFIFAKGFEEKLEHVPNFESRGEAVGFYAYAVTKDGGRYAEVMTLEEINKIRFRSKSADSGPWVSDFEEMAKKTVLRRLAKLLPLSIEFADADTSDAQKEFAGASAIELNLDPQPLEVEEAKQELLPEPETIEIELPKQESEPESASAGNLFKVKAQNAYFSE